MEALAPVTGSILEPKSIEAVCCMPGAQKLFLEPFQSVPIRSNPAQKK